MPLHWLLSLLKHLVAFLEANSQGVGIGFEMTQTAQNAEIRDDIWARSCGFVMMEDELAMKRVIPIFIANSVPVNAFQTSLGR